MKRLKVSNNVIRRLPRYLRKLDELTAQGITRVSSSELGQQLGLTPSQIRQDFSCFGEFGQQGYGYHVPALREQVASILGMDRHYCAILIGVGNIGHALIDNFCFSDWGFQLSAAFDVKPELIGTTFIAYPLSKRRLFGRRWISFFFYFTTIWNFTNVELTEPNSSTIVENIHFSDSLLSLSYYISERQDEKAARAAREARRG